MEDPSEVDSPRAPRTRLGDLLVAAGVIDEAQLNVALAEQGRWETPLGMTLVRLGYLDEATMVRALASQLGLPVVALRGKRINAEIIELVSTELADKYRCLPLLINGDGDARRLYVGLEDPTKPGVVEELTEQIGMAIQPVLVAPAELDEGIHRHYHWDSTGLGAMDPTLAQPLGSTPRADPSSTSPPSLPPLEMDGPAPLSAPVSPPLSAPVSPAPDAPSDDPFDDSDPSFVDFADGPDSAELEFEPSPPPPVTPVQAPTPTPEPMLRAIAQLLIEKRVFTREELVERLRTITASDRGSG